MSCFFPVPPSTPSPGGEGGVCLQGTDSTSHSGAGAAGNHVTSTQTGFPDLKKVFFPTCCHKCPHMHNASVHPNADRQQNCMHVRVHGCSWQHLCSSPERPPTAGQISALWSSHAAESDAAQVMNCGRCSIMGEFHTLM